MLEKLKLYMLVKKERRNASMYKKKGSLINASLDGHYLTNALPISK